MRRAITQIRRRSERCTTAVIVVVALLFGACGGPELGPEEQLHQWVNAAQAAAEAKQRRAMLDLISPAYVDGRGFDRDDIGELLRLYFFRQNSVSLLASIDDIRLYGDSAAEIDLTVGMAGRNNGAFGFSADAYNFQLELERDGDEWLLIAARWGELGEGLH